MGFEDTKRCLWCCRILHWPKTELHYSLVVPFLFGLLASVASANNFKGEYGVICITRGKIHTFISQLSTYLNTVDRTMFIRVLGVFTYS